MAEASAPILKLLEELTKLPGIGPKSAERIAHFLLAGDRKVAVLLAEALRDVVEKVRPCSECFNLTEGNLCPICRDPRRDAGLICVVESPRDVTLFERAGSFRGLYHVLGGRLAPLDGVGPDRFQQIAELTLLDIWGRTNPRPVRSAHDILEMLTVAA